MTLSLDRLGVRAVVLDIEGTTSPIAFVHDVLFPFARAHLSEYLRHAPDQTEIDRIVAQLAGEHAADVARGEAPPPWTREAGANALPALEQYLYWLMDRDRKSPGLKLLQGLVWQRGYQDGVLKGEVFDDVAPAIRRWRRAGRDVAIYSSGSVLAQKLLFQSTGAGDLTALISGFFDTAVGPKMSWESYRAIAAALGHGPSEILFVSDVDGELKAARTAGLHVALSIRPGNVPQADAHLFDVVTAFDQISD